jgi:mannose/cellobiose epimerase-like protein (N-acyl-D-glucosamine 2-epimerase family)
LPVRKTKTVRENPILRLASIVACATLAACSAELPAEPAGAASTQVLNVDQFIYLRCNSTDWNLSERSRLKSTLDPNILRLAIRVSQSWTTSDQCVFTLVSASQPDSWGTAQSNYTVSSPSTPIAVPGGDSLVGPQASQINFSVNYPALGEYEATVDWATKTFAIAASSAVNGPPDASMDGARPDAGIDAGADSPPEASLDAGLDAMPDGSGEAAIDTPDGAVGVPEGAVDSDIDAPDGSVDSGTDASEETVASDTDALVEALDSSIDAPDGTADPGADVSNGTDAGPDTTQDSDADVADSDVLLGADATVGPDAGGAADASSEEAATGAFVPPTGGYPIQCPWLLDTGPMRTHLLGSADFYAKVADPQFGGFFTYLDRQGNPKSTNKSFQVESRDAYAFAHAFMVSGNESYLVAARQALDFLYAHGKDPTNGGYVFLGDRQGNWLPAPSGVPSDKWSFTQHYALSGPTAMCEAAPNATDCGAMNDGMQLLESRYWDPTNGGYFNNATLDYGSVWEKGFTPTIDGITPHILLTYLVTQNPSYRARFISLADDAANHLVGSMSAPGVLFGYPESFTSSWSIEAGSTYGFVGHLYKTAWALARAYLVTGDAKYRTASRQLLMQLWTGGGFDHANGAPNFDYNFNSGVGSTNKEYWQLEQGFTSGITNWYVATNDIDRAIYIEQADRSLCFFMSHLPDAQYGGIFLETNADGSILVSDGSNSPTDKGDQWEGSYHNVELSYYVYVYGNLLLWRRPVTLYYRFTAMTQDQTFTLTPLEIESGALVVTGAALAGQPYGDFDGAARTLHVPAGTGGVFAITYAHAP